MKYLPEKNIEPVQKSPKFNDPHYTASGELRAQVDLIDLEALWINTGTLCNIECANCYIFSSPTNDRLVYVSLEEALCLFDEIKELGLKTTQIGFTGGEPFMNPDMLEMAREALSRDFNILILTNAMQPMQRPKIMEGLLDLVEIYGDKMEVRVSLDHYTQELHETERGVDSWDKTLSGIDWLAQKGFNFTIAGRTCWEEDEETGRNGYGAVFADRHWHIDASDPAVLTLFPEMDETADVPEITTACWDILNVSPDDMMCATSRMAVRKKGSDKLSILPCTLLVYDEQFDMGSSLEDSMSSSKGMFNKGSVKLNHPHCARFCVLGGGACSVSEK